MIIISDLSHAIYINIIQLVVPYMKYIFDDDTLYYLTCLNVCIATSFIGNNTPILSELPIWKFINSNN